MIELTPRLQRILRHIVEEYVAIAQPVASDLIARKYEAELSSATVRNEMAALEEAGLIAQPHTLAVRLVQQAEEAAFAATYFGGLAQLLGQPEFAQGHKLRPILEVLEQQPLLTRLLAESLAGGPGVRVIIGAENQLEQMREAAVVVTRYGSTDDVWGALCVVGPTRLAYWRAVPMVRYVAEQMDAVARRPA